MNMDEFNYIAALLKERSGLIMTPDKNYLFDTRLMPVARAYNLASIEHLIGAMRSPGSAVLIDAVVDAIGQIEAKRAEMADA